MWYFVALNFPSAEGEITLWDVWTIRCFHCFFINWNNSLHLCWAVSVIFLNWVEPVPYLELLGRDQLKKKHPVPCTLSKPAGPQTKFFQCLFYISSFFGHSIFSRKIFFMDTLISEGMILKMLMIWKQMDHLVFSLRCYHLNVVVVIKRASSVFVRVTRNVIIG